MTAGSTHGEASQELLAVAASGVLAVDWYRRTNPEVARSGIDPVVHFVRQGWREGRDPGPLFSVAYYLREYADVRRAGINPLVHYLTHGWREGRRPHPDFDPAAYVAGAGIAGLDICPLVHHAARRTFGEHWRADAPASAARNGNGPGPARAGTAAETPRHGAGVLLVTRGLWQVDARALGIIECLTDQLGCDARVVTFGGLSGRQRVEAWAPVTDLSHVAQDSWYASAVAHGLAAAGYRTAIVDRCGAGLFAAVLRDAGVHVVGLVDDRLDLATHPDLRCGARALALAAQHLVYPSVSVLEAFPDPADGAAAPGGGTGRPPRVTVRRDSNVRRLVMDLLVDSPAALPRVSVVVPNYNYAGFLPARLREIMGQTLPAYELIVLDDASTDGSLQAISEALRDARVATTVVVNSDNSGSVSRQWARGAALATGDLIWIAEADDSAHPDFLRTLAARFDDPETVLAYCQSRQLGPGDTPLAPDCLDYLSDISARNWTRPYTARGADELRECLAVKNTIPNVSAVLFAARPLKQVLETQVEAAAAHVVGGDWFVHAHVLLHGNVAFTPETLNAHRNHPGSVTQQLPWTRHVGEIAALQRLVRRLVRVPETTAALAASYLARVRVEWSGGQGSDGAVADRASVAS